MFNEGNQKVNIKDLPKNRQRKVRKVRGRMRRGSYIVSNKITDDKTTEKVLGDVNS